MPDEPVTPPPDPPPPPEPPNRPDDGAKAEVDKWRHLSREHEKQAKALTSELEQLRRQSMSDQERAIAEAKAQGRTEAEQLLAPIQGENTRLRVAIDKRLPAELVDRLRGSTPEELSADADQLLALFGSGKGAPAEPAKPPVTDFGQGRREGTPASTVAAGRERGRADRAAAEAEKRDPLAGMRRLGGP